MSAIAFEHLGTAASPVSRAARCAQRPLPPPRRRSAQWPSRRFWLEPRWLATIATTAVVAACVLFGQLPSC